jgi:hypothetical protein
MTSPPSPRRDDEFGSWLEQSIQRPVYIDRSDSEKAAEARLIREKAKTEWWNRSLSKALFALGIGIPVAVVCLLLGIWVGSVMDK